MPPTLAERTRYMQPSPIREFLKLADKPGMLSLAGGLPAAETFPVEALRKACDTVLRHRGAQALQYAASEGLPGLREWVAGRLTRPGWQVSPEQVVITTGSQQALDLLGRVLVDAGAPVLVEQPTYLGALQAFAPYAPMFRPWAGDAHGPSPAALDVPGVPARVAYLVPTYQNPTGLCVGADRRQALGAHLQGRGCWLVEDDPYGDLWFDAPPPAPVARWAPARTIYLGSFSKTLAPGLRLGYAVLPGGDEPAVQAMRTRFVLAKQAADLHTSAINQHLVLQLLEGGFGLDEHLSSVRRRYRQQRDAMAHALQRWLPEAVWCLPDGGMFFWARLGGGVDTAACLPQALDAGVAYVPGRAFYAECGPRRTPADALRLSFVTLAPPLIEEAVGRLARVIRALA